MRRKRTAIHGRWDRMGRHLTARVGVKAVVFRRARVLILKRFSRAPQYPNYWDLPGGGVEPGETLVQALVREVREETGWTVRVGAPFHAQLLSWPVGHGKKVPSVGVSFHCELAGRSTQPPRLTEHSAYAWIVRSDLRRYRMSRLCAEAIRAAFATQRPSRGLERPGR